jgi:hypothetical protein
MEPIEPQVSGDEGIAEPRAQPAAAEPEAQPAGSANTYVKASDFGLFADVVDPAKNLDHEWDKEKSLEQRGISVITSSGAFVTLIFAVAAIITKFHVAKNLDGAEIGLIVASMFAFLAAGLFGIWVNKPENYGAVGRQLITDALAGNSDIDRIRNATSLAIGHARDVNGAKARRLLVAIACQVLAIAFLVSALIVIVIRG